MQLGPSCTFEEIPRCVCSTQHGRQLPGAQPPPGCHLLLQSKGRPGCSTHWLLARSREAIAQREKQLLYTQREPPRGRRPTDPLPMCPLYLKKCLPMCVELGFPHHAGSHAVQPGQSCLQTRDSCINCRWQGEPSAAHDARGRCAAAANALETPPLRCHGPPGMGGSVQGASYCHLKKGCLQCACAHVCACSSSL